MIRKKGWLSELELEAIRKKVNHEDDAVDIIEGKWLSKELFLRMLKMSLTRGTMR